MFPDIKDALTITDLPENDLYAFGYDATSLTNRYGEPILQVLEDVSSFRDGMIVKNRRGRNF